MKTIKQFFIYWIYYIQYYVSIQYNRIAFCDNPDKALIYKCMLFALTEHHKVRQKYDKKYPYFYHLKMVMEFVVKFHHLVNYDIKCILGALLHDSIEDLHAYTYNDIKAIWGKDVADIVYACTELRGKNREERHGPEYIKLLNEILKGKFVKLCDVCANMTMGKRTGNGMFVKYQKDYPKFKDNLYLYSDGFKEIFDYIETNFINI